MISLASKEHNIELDETNVSDISFPGKILFLCDALDFGKYRTLRPTIDIHRNTMPESSYPFWFKDLIVISTKVKKVLTINITPGDIHMNVAIDKLLVERALLIGDSEEGYEKFVERLFREEENEVNLLFRNLLGDKAQTNYLKFKFKETFQVKDHTFKTYKFGDKLQYDISKLIIKK